MPMHHNLAMADDFDDTDGAFARHRAAGRTRPLLLGNEVIVAHLVTADSLLSRLRGLLGRGALAPSEGLWITPCTSIHMFFMRFPIDAIFIDAHMQVVRVHEDLRPWRMARGGRFAHSVLELPQGKAAFFNIRVGDRLSFGQPGA